MRIKLTSSRRTTSTNLYPTLFELLSLPQEFKLQLRAIKASNQIFFTYLVRVIFQ